MAIKHKEGIWAIKTRRRQNDQVFKGHDVSIKKKKERDSNWQTIKNINENLVSVPVIGSIKPVAFQYSNKNQDLKEKEGSTENSNTKQNNVI